MSSLLLPPGARLIHVGPQKTGTTAIQVALFSARDSMAEHGAYYPRGSYRRRKAGWALGIRSGAPEQPLSLWDKLVTEVAGAGEARVCVSNEDFARADPPQVEKIVQDLGGERVHVLAVARRHDRYFGSQWQESVKASLTFSFDDWLRVVLTDGLDPPYERNNAWMGHDTVALVNRWLPYVDESRMTLVIADEEDRQQLPRLFEEMLGLPIGFLRIDQDRMNRSLSGSEVELIRQLAVAADEGGWTREDWRTWVVREVTSRLKAAPMRGQSSPPMPDWALDRTRELSDQRVEEIKRLPIQIVGDPDRLRVPEPSAAPAQEPDEPTIPVAVAADAIAAVIGRALRSD